MTSQVDFVIAISIFMIFLGVMINFLLNFLTNYFSLTSLTEVRVSATNLYNTLIGSKGLPTNWWNTTRLPIKAGISNDLYRTPIRVEETSGSARTNISINVTILFDQSCENKAWESSARLFDFNGSEVNMQLYNRTYCSSSYLQQANVVFNTTLRASETVFFYLYYSPENSIATSNSSLEFNSTTPNVVRTVFPEEKLQTISIDRLKALRNLTYEQLLRITGEKRNFNIEISE